MFYEHRKTIYTVLIIIGLTVSFLLGQKVGVNKISTVSNDTNKSEESQQKQHENYNQQLSIKGDGYSANYVIEKANLLETNKLSFNVNMVTNENVQTLKVVAKDEENQNLEITNNQSTYAVSFNKEKNKKIKIIVYPLTKDMANNPKLDLSTLPFKETMIDISIVRSEMIDNLKN